MVVGTISFESQMPIKTLFLHLQILLNLKVLLPGSMSVAEIIVPRLKIHSLDSVLNSGQSLEIAYLERDGQKLDAVVEKLVAVVKKLVVIWSKS